MTVDPNLPEVGKDDVAHLAVKVGLSAIPLAGGPIAEVFNAIITPPLARRRDAWLEQLASALVELQKKVDGLKVENLAQDDTFITVVMQATQAAVRTHHDEKLSALRNAVINSAIGGGPEENLQIIFINFVDELTPIHLEILAILEDPMRWGDDHKVTFPDYHSGGPTTVIAEILKDRMPSYFDQIIRDLYNRGLISTDVSGFHGTMTPGGMFASRTTDFGRQFLKYIKLDSVTS